MVASSPCWLCGQSLVTRASEEGTANPVPQPRGSLSDDSSPNFKSAAVGAWFLDTRPTGAGGEWQGLEAYICLQGGRPRRRVVKENGICNLPDMRPDLAGTCPLCREGQCVYGERVKRWYGAVLISLSYSSPLNPRHFLSCTMPSDSLSMQKKPRGGKKNFPHC